MALRLSLRQVHPSRDGDAITARNLQSQLVKLKTRTARPNELLVIWRKPGTDIRSAIAGQRFASGDKVICPELERRYITEMASQPVVGNDGGSGNDWVVQSMLHLANIEKFDRRRARPYPFMDGPPLQPTPV